MPFTNTPKLALPSGASKGDGAGTWVVQWNQLCDNIEARLTKSGVGSPVGVVAGDFIGQKYYRTDSPERWYCTTAGVAGVAQWAATATFVGEVNINGLFKPNAGVSISGGNMVLQPGNKFEGPDGQTWLRHITDDNEMDPFAHAARHRPGATAGVWTTPNDFVPFSIQRIVSSSTQINGTDVSGTTLVDQTFGAAGADSKCSIIVNTAGRPAVTRGLLYAFFQCVVTVNDDRNLEMQVYRGTTAGTCGAIGTAVGQKIATGRLGFDGGDPNTYWNMLTFVEDLPANATLQFSLHGYNSDGNVDCNFAQLTFIDLGTV